MAARECPSCGREVEGVRESCPSCLATLVDDADATVTCPQCGRVCPGRMHSCPGCMALLRPDPEEVEDFYTEALAEGRRLHRPANRKPFASGPSCTVLRLVANGGLVVCGEDGMVEANVYGLDHRAIPPLTCAFGPGVLFRLERYRATDRALVAVGPDGAAIGTYLRTGSVLDQLIDVRDESSAPVARFGPAPVEVGAEFQVVETGGGVVATGDRRDVEIDRWVDDEWALTTRAPRLPMKPLAFVALAVAAKVLFGRPEPVELPKERRPPTDEAVTLSQLLFGDPG